MRTRAEREFERSAARARWLEFGLGLEVGADDREAGEWAANECHWAVEDGGGRYFEDLADPIDEVYAASEEIDAVWALGAMPPVVDLAGWRAGINTVSPN